MADLAKLVVRLEAQSAQLLQELDKANSKINRFERNATGSLDKLNKRFTSFGFGVKTALGTFLGGVSFKALIDANAEAADQFANLENAVERAGDAAGGRSAKQFAEVATEISNVTTQTDEAVQGVQQLLLRFQNIRTDRFDEATKSVLDFATATRRDLASSAELVGKALADPIKGMTQLGKAGVIFSDAQKKVIKDLVETGRRSEAQGLILDKLNQKFGGAAEAARGNFSGALKAVQNSLGELLESDSGLPAATSAMNELATILQDPAVKEGADSLFSIIITGAAKAAKILGETAAGVTAILSKGKTRQEQLQKQIDFLIEQRDSPLPAIANLGQQNDIFPGGGFDVLAGRKDIQQKIDELTREMEALQGLGVAGVNAAKAVKAATDTIPAGAFEFPDIEVVDNTEALAEAAEKLQKKLEAAGASLTEKVQTPVERYEAAVKEADTLLARHIITVDTWFRALALARTELDEMNKSLGTTQHLTLSVEEETRQLQEQLKNAPVSEALGSSIEKGIDDLTESVGKAYEKVDKQTSEFARQAARNVQDILADGIVDALDNGFESGLDGMFDAFVKMLERMAAQAIAANIAGYIFGSDAQGVSASGSSGGSDGGIFGQLLAAFATSMDSGGHVGAGEVVAVGRGAQPELFIPDTAGQMYPAGTWPSGGSSNVNQNIFFQGQPTERSLRQLELETGRRQRVAQARLG